MQNAGRAGFEVSATVLGHGFVHTQDRIGAINGELLVGSEPGSGTTVRASIPGQPLQGATLTAAQT
jgi:signal transduction histidine kinase